MKLYLTILQGETAHTAEPVVVTSDDEILRRIAELLRQRINPADHPDTSNWSAGNQTKTRESADQ